MAYTSLLNQSQIKAALADPLIILNPIVLTVVKPDAAKDTVKTVLKVPDTPLRDMATVKTLAAKLRVNHAGTL